MLGENIFKLRKKQGLSQEQLANLVNVTRQTISNWELNETSPNPEQLKSLSKILKISIDELLNNEEYQDKATTANHSYGYEYISKRKIRGIPLVHIHLGLGHGIRKAKGIIAIGDIAQGVVALGGIAMGLFTLGGIGLGVISLGGLALGILLSIGGLSIGSIALGGLAIGLFSIGGCAIGLYAIGGCSIAKYIAAGDFATGYIAIGNHVQGTVEIIKAEATSKEISQTILEYLPKTWKWIIFIMSNINI